MHVDDDGFGFVYEATEQATGTESLVTADIARRQRLGVGKYGQTVAEKRTRLIRSQRAERLFRN